MAEVISSGWSTRGSRGRPKVDRTNLGSRRGEGRREGGVGREEKERLATKARE